jgi:CheY-like chemotaxis protein
VILVGKEGRLGELFVGLRVLVVEDEALIVMMLEDMLTDLGATLAGHAGTVSEGMSLVERGGFDAAILDLNVAGQKVFPVAEQLAARGVPFLFASGYGASGVTPEFAARPVVAKPYQIDELSSALGRALSAQAPITSS